MLRIGSRLSVFCVAALLLGVSFVLAEQPSYESLQRSLFVLRHRTHPEEEAMQGIWKFDPESRTYTRLGPLYYGEIPGFGANLAGFEDRLQLQGRHYLEFELPTMRLLRRYEDSRDLTGTWVFHGTLVTPEQGKRAGVLPGIYGFPICPDTIATVPICGEMQLPGYAQPTFNTTNFNLLYRRDADPAATRLELVQRLPPFGGINSPYRRFASFDEGRKQLWMWSEGAEGFSGQVKIVRLSALPLTSAGVLDEILLTESKADTLTASQDRLRLTRAFTHHSVRDSFFHSY